MKERLLDVDGLRGTGLGLYNHYLMVAKRRLKIKQMGEYSTHEEMRMRKWRR